MLFLVCKHILWTKPPLLRSHISYFHCQSLLQHIPFSYLFTCHFLNWNIASSLVISEWRDSKVPFLFLLSFLLPCLLPSFLVISLLAVVVEQEFVKEEKNVTLFLPLTYGMADDMMSVELVAKQQHYSCVLHCDNIINIHVLVERIFSSFRM